MTKTKEGKVKEIFEDFDKRFSVFDGSQKIIKHVTYSIWIKDFIKDTLTQDREEIYMQGYNKGFDIGSKMTREDLVEAGQRDREEMIEKMKKIEGYGTFSVTGKLLDEIIKLRGR